MKKFEKASWEKITRKEDFSEFSKTWENSKLTGAEIAELLNEIDPNWKRLEAHIRMWWTIEEF